MVLSTWWWTAGDVMDDPMDIGSVGTARCDRFQAELLQLDQPSVVEIGTKRWEKDRPTHHQAWAPHAFNYVMVDAEDGTDVDYVQDAHSMPAFADGGMDAVIAVSVWEHLERPWKAAEAMARILRPGGLIYVGTHQSFPIHGYPNDFFRFSAEALALIFRDAGFTEVHTGYTYPCQIIPPPEVTRWNKAAESFLNVDLFGVR